MPWIAAEGEILPGIINVGEKDLSSYLVMGKDKILLMDCNMSFVNRVLTRNLKNHIPDGRGLNGILLTHSHFDHVGCMPFIREKYPDLLVYGHEYAEEVLKRENARQLIHKLNSDAAREYAKHELHQSVINYDEKKFYVDRVVKEGDKINIGGEDIIVIETPGHTRCSLAYYLAERGVLFAGEAIGAFINPGFVCPEYLSDYNSYMASLSKCKELRPRVICMPHFGVITGEDADKYWEWAQEGAVKGQAMILDMLGKGCTEENIIEKFREEFYTGKLLEFQPEEAFVINVQSSIKVIKKQCLS